jgi:hypothetical protein
MDKSKYDCEFTNDTDDLIIFFIPSKMSLLNYSGILERLKGNGYSVFSIKLYENGGYIYNIPSTQRDFFNIVKSILKKFIVYKGDSIKNKKINIAVISHLSSSMHPFFGLLDSNKYGNIYFGREITHFISINPLFSNGHDGNPYISSSGNITIPCLIYSFKVIDKNGTEIYDKQSPYLFSKCTNPKKIYEKNVDIFSSDICNSYAPTKKDLIKKVDIMNYLVDTILLFINS